tara:strand:+ start:1545 stop:2123 length:579 start_codon:yes stop_codon:yes gene_type:complete
VENEKKDGRFKRSERSRQAIIDAMLESMEQGCYMPTAQQVADQAGISIRTVFRHFSEMELLYKEINEAQRPNYEIHFALQDFSGTLEQRIARIVDGRIAGFVQVHHLIRATHALFWRSQIIKDNYQKTQKTLRLLLFKMLPELKDKDSQTQELADALTSFDFFERLYTFQDLSIQECTSIISNKLTQLIASP